MHYFCEAFLNRLNMSRIRNTEQVVIYSGDGLTAEQLVSNALSSFSIALPRSFQVSDCDDIRSRID